jgi:hypothetical protein
MFGVVDCGKGKRTEKLANEFRIAQTGWSGNIFDQPGMEGDIIQLVDSNLCLAQSGSYDTLLETCDV